MDYRDIVYSLFVHTTMMVDNYEIYKAFLFYGYT